jgi:hypothetical protein
MEQTKKPTFKQFYFAHLIKQGTPLNIQPTHTRMPDKDLNIFAGSFYIPSEELQLFHELYYDWIFVKGNCEYLTEKQMSSNYKMVVDLDFRYNYDVDTRPHNKENIYEFVHAYLEEFKKHFKFNKDVKFNIWVCEKPNVNRLEDKSLTKDGIHLVFELSVPYPIQERIRKSLIAQFEKENYLDLPLTNSWDSVFDEGISKGTCNWTLFGSQKPANEAYQVTQLFQISYDETDGEFMMANGNPSQEPMNVDFETFQALSVQTKGIELELINPSDALPNEKKMKSFKPISPSPTSVTQLYNMEQPPQQQQDKFLELLDIIGLGGKITKIQHPLWYKIGSILKTNGYPKLVFEDFTKEYVSNKVADLDNIWDKHISIEQVYSIYGLQKIAKDINLGMYNEWFIKYKQYIPIKVLGKGNNDIAEFISHKIKDELVYCNKSWILFDKKINLWRSTDAPQTKVCSFIQGLIDSSVETLTYKIGKTDDEEHLKRLRHIQGLYSSHRLNMSNNTDNSMILKLLKDYLYDGEFFSKLDVGKYKVAYKNGILDLETLVFREGLLSSDMLTKTIPYNYEKASDKLIAEIRQEIKKICNNNETHLEYYLSTLGYAMTGDSIRLQEFYYLIGQKASNGKSVIFEALSDIIPCYAMKIESSSFEMNNSNFHKEVATWKGIRVGWINELSKKKQNPETLKEVADGTSVKYKVMYGVSDLMPITYKPFVISNHTISIDADKGIARRLRMFQLDSEFIENLEVEDFEKCQFKTDTNFGKSLRTTYKNALMDLIYSYSKKFVDDGYKLKAYPAEWNKVKEECVSDNNVFGEFMKENFEFGEDYEISEFSLKKFLESNKFGNIKFNDEVKKNKWNFKRGQDKKWRGLKRKEIMEEEC